jgi:putative transcriptional regulator
MWQARSLPASALLVSLIVSLIALASPIAAQQAPEKSASLAGQFLVATPAMSDPRFDHAVILIARHDKDGAFGLIINRPAAERPLSELLEALGDKGTPVNGTVRLFAGGPVQPELGFVIHSPDYHSPQTLDVDGHVAVTMNREILHDIGTGKGPQKSMIAFGYAGWAPGQLEGEIARRSWTTVPAENKLIFDEDREKLWDIVYAMRIQDL